MEIKTKFSVKDEVWFMANFKPCKAKVKAVQVKLKLNEADEEVVSIFYRVESATVTISLLEGQLFSKKHQLRDALFGEEE